MSDWSDSSTPDQRIVEKFSDELDGGIVPVATLSMLWYVEPDGRDGVLTKFDGEQRVSVTIGDLMLLVHDYMHADDDRQ